MNFEVIINELLTKTLYLNILESLKNVLIGFIVEVGLILEDGKVNFEKSYRK